MWPEHRWLPSVCKLHQHCGFIWMSMCLRKWRRWRQLSRYLLLRKMQNQAKTVLLYLYCTVFGLFSNKCFSWKIHFSVIHRKTLHFCFNCWNWLTWTHYHLDVDECLNNLHNCAVGIATCTNTQGSYTCACNTGYAGNGRQCVGKSFALQFSWTF